MEERHGPHIKGLQGAQSRIKKSTLRFRTVKLYNTKSHRGNSKLPEKRRIYPPQTKNQIDNKFLNSYGGQRDKKEYLQSIRKGIVNQRLLLWLTYHLTERADKPSPSD